MQQHYAANLLHKVGLSQEKSVTNPLPSKASHFQLLTQPFHDPSMYRMLTGSLQYLTITHPDISFAVNNFCQHMHNPSEGHF